jgi:YegS/Rv2252/BmrU family lipid kinase
MSESKKVFFIINKFSGTGYRPGVEGRIITVCGKLNLECTIEFTRERGHAVELARQAVREQFGTVIAVGGDGTVNEVAQGLVHTDATMGILPKGSGNGLARHLRIPMNLTKALALLTTGKSIRMDTILINGDLSVNVSGIGFDGHVVRKFGKNGKRGLVGYVKLVLKEFSDFKEFEVRVLADAESYHRKAFILAVANSSQFGNNARISPMASVCDQLIDLCFIKKVPLLQAPAFAQRMFSGRIDKSSYVEILKTKEIDIGFPVPMPFHIDGEAREPASRFSIQLQPASLKVLVPIDPNSKP